MLMSADALHERLQNGDNVIVFDCRFSLADVEAGRRAYLAGHIPSAIYLHLDEDMSGPKGQGGGRHPLPDPNALAAKLASYGVSAEKTVVAYDDGEGMAARAWWLLRWLGHADVALLDGGYSAWVQAGYTVQTDVPQPAPAIFAANIQTDLIAPLSAVAAISAGTQPGTLVDARAASRYRGENETIDAQAGHIPGAANAPWQEGIGEGGKWLDATAQRQRFAPYLGREGELVMYCGSGVTACNNLFALHLAGVKDAKLYPGSWSEWSADANRKVATGDESGL